MIQDDDDDAALKAKMKREAAELKAAQARSVHFVTI
jgi:Translation machinery associated TMA7